MMNTDGSKWESHPRGKREAVTNVINKINFYQQWGVCLVRLQPQLSTGNSEGPHFYYSENEALSLSANTSTADFKHYHVVVSAHVYM